MNPKKAIMTGLTTLVVTTAAAQASHHKQISDTTAKKTTQVLMNPYGEDGEKNSLVVEDTLYRGDQHGNDHHDLTPSLNNVDGVTFETETVIKTGVSAYMHHITENLTLEHIQLLNKNLGISVEVANIVEEAYHRAHTDEGFEGKEELFADELEAQLGIFFRKDIKQGLEFIHTLKGGFGYNYDREQEGENIQIHNTFNGKFSTTVGLQKKFGKDRELGIVGTRIGTNINNKDIAATASIFTQYNHNNISLGGKAEYDISEESLETPLKGLNISTFLATKVGKYKNLIIQVFGGLHQGAGYGGAGISRYPDIHLKRKK